MGSTCSTASVVSPERRVVAGAASGGEGVASADTGVHADGGRNLHRPPPLRRQAVMYSRAPANTALHPILLHGSDAQRSSRGSWSSSQTSSNATLDAQLNSPGAKCDSLREQGSRRLYLRDNAGTSTSEAGLDTFAARLCDSPDPPEGLEQRTVSFGGADALMPVAAREGRRELRRQVNTSQSHSHGMRSVPLEVPSDS